ncbi:MAG: DNA topoisomerase I [Candidatus Aenigmarchaeota archaeon]|nr:DNA topoisomerase I [Candidatus Aenigmarchaeota archaeon]
MATLIIAEKPSSSEKIAAALAEGKIEKIASQGVTSYRFTRGGKEMVVAPAVGHLFVLAQKGNSRKWTYPAFETEWKPVFVQNRLNTWSKKYYQNLQRLAKEADEFISACDYDIEGSVIAFNIIRFLCNTHDGRRMKFSTLTKDDLVRAYETASSHLDTGQIEAGLARHELDFLWGINTSRALTLALREAGAFKVLSTGRVQGPTLAMLEEREKEIKAFVPTPFWELQLQGTVRGEPILADHAHGAFEKREEADQSLNRSRGKPGSVQAVERKEYEQRPPFPFDLTTLQREAYKHFGSSPKQTLDVAQSLYEQALISYPRTSSQKLPVSLGLRSVIANLGKQKPYASLAAELLKGEPVPNEGPKSDPAHPAIYPTGTSPKALSLYERRLYDLIARRFLAVFAPPATRERVRATIDVNGEAFVAEGFRTVSPGWMTFYGSYATFKELVLPAMQEGDAVANDRVEMLDKQTQPPPRLTQATVLKEMEKLGLGTKATRAGILETLYDRGYIDEKSIVVSMLGEAVITALKKHCSDIISVDLTRSFEEEMEAIREGKKKREAVIAEARETLERIMAAFKKNEKKIGGTLLEGMREVMRVESTIGTCTCGQTLVVKRSRQGKRFVGCTGYPACTQTFSLPHRGYLKPLPKTCPTCGLFIVMVKYAGRRPWELCVRDGFVNKRPVASPASSGAAATPGDSPPPAAAVPSPPAKVRPVRRKKAAALPEPPAGEPPSPPRSRRKKS